MYLKKIMIAGFKSFADKTVLELSKGVTGVVGPNGSGKSNVVDAVKWVLGEQSIKQLRGASSMVDVIFSGSKSRGASNTASVTLVFDNQDHYLNLDYTEVSIRRRVYKDGTNEYSINDEKCRLKDVLDLFLDSGASKESFNIISQGKVEEVILSKPENRRTIFEEAAGVAKYRKRKEEALHKLEKTHDNLKRVNDIKIELENQVEPLRIQKEQALLYKELDEKLKNIEVALIASDIHLLNTKYQTAKKEKETLEEELVQMSAKTSTFDARSEELKKQMDELDKNINDMTKELMEKTALKEQASSLKNALNEKQKYEVEDMKIHDNLVLLKESKLKEEGLIESLKRKIKITQNSLEEVLKEEKEKEDILKNKQKEKEMLGVDLSSLTRESYHLKQKSNILKDEIENNLMLPSAVRSTLNNPKLKGVLNTIGSIIEVEEEYATSITTALGASSNYVITKTEEDAKDAISYLKENKLGRVTFFPLSIIKSKKLDINILEDLKKEDGFIDIASSLVKCDSIYQNIIENQLGITLVVDTIENANKLAKKLNYKYRIVTLDGTLLHMGGSLTGGSIYKTKTMISEKYELETTLKQLDYTEASISKIEDKINICDYDMKNIEDQIYLNSKKKIELSEVIASLSKEIEDKCEKLRQVNEEIETSSSLIQNTLSQKEEEAMQNFYLLKGQVEKLEESLDAVKEKRNILTLEKEEIEFSTKKENSIFLNKTKQAQALEVDINRMDVKLDTLLTSLSENYSMTFEYAISNYALDVDNDDARKLVSNLKSKIKSLGEINMLAIEEYDRVNERYTFLENQQKDLLKAEDTLLQIIREMDEVMEKEFSKAFEIIRKNFQETFKELFHGGSSDLKLTDPSNMLETGIEIVASPPGKTLKSISFLSGGEKTFTAISLLFAILKSRPVPYCILDEVEAALDEVNVDSFGSYLQNFKNKTQFILITHKKKTMEYADYLYGITMQESGVSKVVSVKLNEVKHETIG